MPEGANEVAAPVENLDPAVAQVRDERAPQSIDRYCARTEELAGPLADRADLKNQRAAIGEIQHLMALITRIRMSSAS